LLARVQAGDAQALDALVARFRPRLVRWASGRLPVWARDLCATQDLVQDTLVQVFRKIDSIEIRGDGALQAYLRQALINRIRNEIRRVKRRPGSTGLDSGLPDDSPSPVEALVGRESLEAYERALDSLRPEDRELIVARLEFGFTNEQLAQAFDRPSANAARVALQRAVVRLVEQMKGA
jgi:RNA polymerase sigma-70 factor (ECF subfamily)